MTNEEMIKSRHKFAAPVPEIEFTRCATDYKYMDRNFWLLTSAFLYGNPMCLINDPHIDPFAQLPEESDSENDGCSGLIAESNCKMVSCLIRGWPFIVLVSTEMIRPGEELLYKYGDSAATGDGYWHLMQTSMKNEAEVLELMKHIKE